MASKVNFVPNKQGYWALQRQVGVAAITPHVEGIAARANNLCGEEGGVYGSTVGQVGARTRNKVPYGIVHCDNYEAMLDNAKRNTLARAMGGA